MAQRSVAAQAEALMTLMSEFSRTKLSLQSLMLRPIWRDELLSELQAAGLSAASEGSDEQVLHWLHFFHRAGRLLLGAEQGVNMRMMAEQFGVPLSSATRMVEHLVQRDLLERQNDAADRRVVLVRFTPSGEQAFTIIDKAFRRRIESLLSEFSVHERQQLLSLSQRLFELWSASLQASEQQESSREA